MVEICIAQPNYYTNMRSNALLLIIFLINSGTIFAKSGRGCYTRNFYHGTVFKDAKGNRCKKWNDRYPLNIAKKYPQLLKSMYRRFGSIDNNQCQVLRPGSAPKCFIQSNGSLRTCSQIPKCDVDNECYNGKGYNYMGKMDAAKSGDTCVHWSSPTGKKLMSMYKLRKNDFQGKDWKHNFCRNFDPEKNTKTPPYTMPWCFIKRQSGRYVRGMCNIESCPGQDEPQCGLRPDKDVEIKRITNGKKCKNWRTTLANHVCCRILPKGSTFRKWKR